MHLTISIHFIRFQPLKFKPILKRHFKSLASFHLRGFFYLYLLNLHHIITPADVSPNGNAIHTPISP